MSVIINKYKRKNDNEYNFRSRKVHRVFST
jgi:hypothetical protein